MKYSLKASFFSVLCGASLLMSVDASTINTVETWNFKTGQTANGNQALTLTSSAGNTAFISGWSSSQSNANSTVTAAKKMTLDSNWGIQLWNNSDSGSPNHAIDNMNGYDFILLEFPNPTELTSLTNTWIDRPGYDWISVGAFDANPFAAGTTNWLSVASSAIVTASYKGIGTQTPYVFANHDSIVPSHNIQNVSSKFWLIGAYNATFNGGNCGTTCFGDALKFGSITTLTKTNTTPETTPIPAPGSLPLILMASILLLRRLRR